MKKVELRIPCRWCKRIAVFQAPEKGLIEWQQGKLIQEAMPSLSADERELLISQTCPKCFDAATDIEEEEISESESNEPEETWDDSAPDEKKNPGATLSSLYQDAVRVTEDKFKKPYTKFGDKEHKFLDELYRKTSGEDSKEEESWIELPEATREVTISRDLAPPAKTAAQMVAKRAEELGIDSDDEITDVTEGRVDVSPDFRDITQANPGSKVVEYKWFVVDRNGKPLSGWEFKQDALDASRDEAVPCAVRYVNQLQRAALADFLKRNDLRLKSNPYANAPRAIKKKSSKNAKRKQGFFDDVTRGVYNHHREKPWHQELKDIWNRDEGRLILVPDETADMESLKGDSFNPEVNTDIPREKLEAEEKDFEQRVERDGVWGAIAEVYLPDEDAWEELDAIWGFVGGDFIGSGYDEDMAKALIEKIRGSIKSEEEPWKASVERLKRHRLYKENPLGDDARGIDRYVKTKHDLLLKERAIKSTQRRFKKKKEKFGKREWKYAVAALLIMQGKRPRARSNSKSLIKDKRFDKAVAELRQWIKDEPKRKAEQRESRRMAKAWDATYKNRDAIAERALRKFKK